MSEPDWLSVKAAAALKNMSKRGIIHAITRGDFPGARKVDPDALTSSWLLPRADVEAYEPKQPRTPIKRPESKKTKKRAQPSAG